MGGCAWDGCGCVLACDMDWHAVGHVLVTGVCLVCVSCVGVYLFVRVCGTSMLCNLGPVLCVCVCVCACVRVCVCVCVCVVFEPPQSEPKTENRKVVCVHTHRGIFYEHAQQYTRRRATRQTSHADLYSGSNDHTTKFWCRNRPGDTLRDRYNADSLPIVHTKPCTPSRAHSSTHARTHARNLLQAHTTLALYQACTHNSPPLHRHNTHSPPTHRHSTHTSGMFCTLPGMPAPHTHCTHCTHCTHYTHTHTHTHSIWNVFGERTTGHASLRPHQTSS